MWDSLKRRSYYGSVHKMSYSSRGSTKCLILLAVIALFFVTEIIPLAVTAMAGSIACGLLTGTGENSLMIGVMLVGAGLSSVLSNTGTAACLLPVVLGVCAAAKIPASTELMPLAFACGLGGIITLVGTPPNIIASGALEQAGYRAFGFFEFAKIGIPLTLAGLVYMMFIGKHLLPKRVISEDTEVEQEIEANETSTNKMIVSGVILLAVVLTMALGIKGVTLEMAAITGAIVAVLTGCLTEKQAYASIDWVTIFLFAGMMPVSSAMSKTGAGKVIAEWAVGLMGGTPSPMIVTAVLFILSCGLTQFMSNTASAALLCPIGIAISKQLGADPAAVLMAIAVAASCAFATPVGTPPNTLVLGPGGFKFMDYVKAGTGLVIVCFVISLILIPMFWPFFPGK